MHFVFQLLVLTPQMQVCQIERIKPNSTLASINISQTEILDVLKTSKATWPDRINCKILKETTSSMLPLL